MSYAPWYLRETVLSCHESDDDVTVYGGQMLPQNSPSRCNSFNNTYILLASCYVLDADEPDPQHA